MVICGPPIVYTQPFLEEPLRLLFNLCILELFLAGSVNVPVMYCS